MSAFRDPVGPQPGRVYWRRRILVLLGALAIIAVVLLIVFRPAEPPAPAGAESPAPATSASTEPTAPAPPGDPEPCTAGAVTVEAVTDQDAYDPGAEPQLSWTLSNTGAAPCSINVGTAQQVFTITSGDEVIWRSTDCQSDPTDFPLTLEPGAPPTSSATIPWDRTRSAPDTCDSEREPVTAGGASYHLDVSVGGIESTDTKQFLLN